MKFLKFKKSFFCLLVGFFIYYSPQVLATTDTGVNPAGAAGFTYQIDYPENQVSDSGFFDLKMSPGQKQTITIKLINPSNEDVSVDVGLNGAKTNKNGVIEYGETKIKNDVSLKYPFEKLVKGPEKVKLKAGETVDLNLDIEMPEVEFDGKIVGGVTLIRSEEDDKNNKGDGTQIVNRYRYAIAVVLKNNDNEVLPKLELREVYADQFNAQNTIYVDFSNTAATFFDHMSVEVQITKKNEATVLYESKKTNMRMAPNTLMSYPVSMQGERMVAGEYTAKVLVKGKSDVREEWTKDFTISEKEASKFNERDVGLYEEKETDWKFIFILVISFIVFVGIVYGGLMFLKKKKDAKKKEKRKKVKSKQSDRNKKYR